MAGVVDVREEAFRHVVVAAMNRASKIALIMERAVDEIVREVREFMVESTAIIEEAEREHALAHGGVNHGFTGVIIDYEDG